jgi:hypothetical protein
MSQQHPHGPATPQTPRDPRLKDGWRAAAAAYRKAYGEHSNPHRGCADECYDAAIAALKEVVPDIGDREAMLKAVAAIHYASVVAPKWL